MRAQTIVVGLLLTLAGEVCGQDNVLSDTLKQNKKMEYFFYLQSGALIGCNECSRGKEVSFSGATVHGVKLGRRLRVGGGIGIDAYYNWNSLPVFGSISWDLFARKNAFFVLLNYGGTLTSWKYSQFDEYGYKESKGGRMVNPMVGYRITYHDVNISLLAGYKSQKMSSYYEYPSYYWDPIRGQLTGDPMTTKMSRELNRFMISMAIGWK